ncbi:MAG: hypothetical protein COZ34_03525 [Candidatus Pacebacteria bacterium CG_4_10_14_3_um_filter_34_15]|nr:hypothetical protein [Candidatus Pacearchaeota archaeon]NCQ65396.1 hypothetical protein [Candidatus Paceibacterota bacterium]OIO44222.1 MAG: hypothetical protein AUJ41_03510 [Candidatus Pacebacteria bacterium CG1_02_43_31]PIQ80780.1 MAG: hypothetical protein COV78_03740 [Candidatus Pacebacteria bacterium CG11_big_fil_rev_8_21_14_0_20_34_55]PIX81391.1 MAG: hypothetical protein COZ34_03525 [Candidatus Pacebacteria bacterium CG_4_10_14_3_um_filter_34_15]PJC43880.1 MAG: hypothetical protein CO0
MKKQFVDLDNAREDEQKQVMEEIIKAGHCPFCQENFKLYNSQTSLRDGKYWFMIKNRWPYKNTKVHLIAIYKQHATNLDDIDSESGKELLDFLKWAEKEYDVPGGGWSMRFGDTDYSAGTVNHIHVQFIQPDINAPEYKPVKIKIGKRFK